MHLNPVYKYCTINRYLQQFNMKSKKSTVIHVQLSMHAPYAPYPALNSAKLSATHIGFAALAANWRLAFPMFPGRIDSNRYK